MLLLCKRCAICIYYFLMPKHKKKSFFYSIAWMLVYITISRNTKTTHTLAEGLPCEWDVRALLGEFYAFDFELIRFSFFHVVAVACMCVISFQFFKGMKIWHNDMEGRGETIYCQRSSIDCFFFVSFTISICCGIICV